MYLSQDLEDSWLAISKQQRREQGPRQQRQKNKPHKLGRAAHLPGSARCNLKLQEELVRGLKCGWQDSLEGTEALRFYPVNRENSLDSFKLY